MVKIIEIFDGSRKLPIYDLEFSYDKVNNIT